LAIDLKKVARECRFSSLKLKESNQEKSKYKDCAVFVAKKTVTRATGSKVS